MMNKIYRILRSKLWGKYNNDSWIEERRKICRGCPLMSENTSQTRWYWMMLNLDEPYCTVCGCEIAAKTSEEMEECPEGKWKQFIKK